MIWARYNNTHSQGLEHTRARAIGASLWIGLNWEVLLDTGMTGMFALGFRMKREGLLAQGWVNGSGAELGDWA